MGVGDAQRYTYLRIFCKRKQQWVGKALRTISQLRAYAKDLIVNSLKLIIDQEEFNKNRVPIRQRPM